MAEAIMMKLATSPVKPEIAAAAKDRYQRIEQALAKFAQDGQALSCLGSIASKGPKSLHCRGL